MFMGSEKTDDFLENSDFIVSSHLMEGISLYWKLNLVPTEIQNGVRSPCVIEWKKIRSEKDIKYPDCGQQLGADTTTVCMHVLYVCMYVRLYCNYERMNESIF